MKRYVGFYLLLGACQGAGSAPPPPTAQAATPRHEGPRSADDALDRLDSRQAVPLLPRMALHQKENMRDHLAAVQEVVGATAKHDFAGVAAAAKRIGYSEAMGQMCQHMGAGAPGFTDQALAFHHTADRIGAAADKKDATAVLVALSETLAACTTCHAAYKQKLVDTLPE